MMKLLKYEGYQVTVEPELLILKPFKRLWDRDRSQSKEKALRELGFIYFFCDPRSDYQYITDLDIREEQIKLGEGYALDWKPDKLLIEAMEFYTSFKPTAALLLEDTRIAVDKLRTLLRNIDLKETDDKGKPIYTLNTVTATIKQIPSLIEELDKAERSLASELKNNSKMRGQGEKTIAEDGFNFM